MNINELKGTFYPLVLKGASLVGSFRRAEPPEVRVNANGSVEFINFTPDPNSRELFELLGKDVSHDWRVKAGYEEPESIYNIKP